MSPELIRKIVLIGHFHMLWIVGLLILIFGIRFVMRLVLRDPWREQDTLLSFFYVLALDLQFVMGVTLWVLLKFFFDGGSPARLYEHPTLMILAVAAAHIGHKKQKRGGTTTERAKESVPAFERRARKGMYILGVSAMLVILAAARVLTAG